MRSTLAPLLGSLLAVACTMPNPDFDDQRGELGESGDGDGDPAPGDGDGSPGDGDGSPGDGDGSPGDGDGSPGDGDGTPGDGDGTPGDGDGTPGDGDGEPIPCADGRTDCDGVCKDLQFDQSNCGFCGNQCPGVCAEGQCVAKRYVFVSSEPFQGNFGGPAEASSHCNQLAMFAQLPGEYAAWVSDGQQTAAEVLDGPGAFVLRDGPVIAYSWADLTDGDLVAQINKDEFGDLIDGWPVEDCGLASAVWTGTDEKGLLVEPLCIGWNSNSAEVFGTVGDPTKTNSTWSQAACDAPCITPLPVYCVQMP